MKDFTSQCGNGRLINCDAMLLMDDESLRKSARLVVTSPPYNAGKEYEEWESWEEYFVFLSRFAELCEYLVEDDGYVVVNFGVEYTAPKRIEQVYHEAFEAVGWRVITERVWKKKSSTVRCKAYNWRSPRAIADHEHVWTLRRKQDTEWDPPRDKQRSLMSVWDTSDEPVGALKQHPAAFPEAIPRWAIQVHCDPGDLVVDPFSGGGTTVCVAVGLGMRGIGTELREDYHATAVENLQSVQRSLF
jgi:DNA modification methylase